MEGKGLLGQGVRGTHVLQIWEFGIAEDIVPEMGFSPEMLMLSDGPFWSFAI